MTEKPEPPHPLPLVESELADVGRFIVLWNLIEQQLDDIVSTVSKLDFQAVGTVMSTPHVPARADIFEAIFRSSISDKSLVRDAAKCAKKVKELSNFRNEVAHGRWRLGRPILLPEGQRPLVPFSSKQAQSGKLVYAGDLLNKFSELCRLSCRLEDLYWRCRHLDNPAFFSLPSPYHERF